MRFSLFPHLAGIHFAWHSLREQTLANSKDFSKSLWQMLKFEYMLNIWPCKYFSRIQNHHYLRRCHINSVIVIRFTTTIHYFNQILQIVQWQKSPFWITSVMQRSALYLSIKFHENKVPIYRETNWVTWTNITSWAEVIKKTVS